MDREISWIGTRGCAELPFPESGKVFGKLRNLMNSFNLFARRDEISRDTAPVREETAVTPSSAIRPTLSSGENPQDKERNVFGEGLRIDGDVSSDTDIVIRGIVHGNIVCRGDIELSGSVQGDIEGRNIRIVGGRIEGNVVCSETLKVERSSVVGNLTAQRAQIDNKVEGNITVHGTLALLREADIRGDIVAGALSIEEGAVLTGKVSVSPGGASSDPAGRKRPGTVPDAVHAAPMQEPVAAEAGPKSVLASISGVTERPNLGRELFPQSEPVGAVAAVTRDDDQPEAADSPVTVVIGVIGILLWGFLLLRNSLADLLQW